MSIHSKLEINHENYADPETGILPYLRQCMVTLIRQENDDALQRMVNDNARLSEALYDLNDEIGKMFSEYEQMRNKRDAIQKALEEKQAAAQALIEEMEVKFGKDDPEPEPEPEIPNIASLIEFDDPDETDEFFEEDDGKPQPPESMPPAVQFDDELEEVESPVVQFDEEPEEEQEEDFGDPFAENDVSLLFESEPSEDDSGIQVADLFDAPVGVSDDIYGDVIDTGDIPVFEDDDPDDELPYVDNDEDEDLFDDLDDELVEPEPEPEKPANPMDMNSAILDDDDFFD